MRQNEKRRQINRNNRSQMRTAIKKLRSALSGGSADESQTLLPVTISVIDNAVNKGVIHRNTAARYKARLTSRVNATANQQ